MENHNDEHIVCADCGASFLFSAGEAAVFEQRGLAAPKRCKDCRRARKENRPESGGQRPSRGFRGGQAGGGQAGGGWNGGGNGAAPRGPRGGGDRPAYAGRGGNGPARYTGDVNEYRSPMADGGWQQPRWQQPQQPAARGNGFQRPRAARQGGPGVYRHDDGQYRAPSGQIEGTAALAQERPRRQGPPGRPQAEMFSITCDSCGAQAEVPFKPAEGREVFCQTCYRARKPPV